MGHAQGVGVFKLAQFGGGVCGDPAGTCVLAAFQAHVGVVLCFQAVLHHFKLQLAYSAQEHGAAGVGFEDLDGAFFAQLGQALLQLLGAQGVLEDHGHEQFRREEGQARELQIGDIGSGAPELRADSRYNQDNQKIISNYSIGLDVLSVFLTIGGRSEACLDPAVMRAVETFDFKMREVPGVQSVQSVAGMGKQVIAGNNEGNPRWAAIPGSAQGLQQGAYAYSPDSGLVTDSCQKMQILVFLTDHEGASVAHVLGEAKRIIGAIQVPGVTFHLAGGNIGVMAASNEAVKQAEVVMLAALFFSVALFCLLTFRSLRAVLCILVPLAIVAVLCNALMALLGIGLKVATLPVMALGVGVGVDYGIYLYERIEHEMAAGQDLREAFYRAMCQRGTAAVFTAVTMSLGVCTWVFAPLKFQADMGVLLAFMFLVNVLGAIFLLPALAAWFNLGKPLVNKRPSSVRASCDQPLVNL